MAVGYSLMVHDGKSVRPLLLRNNVIMGQKMDKKCSCLCNMRVVFMNIAHKLGLINIKEEIYI